MNIDMHIERLIVDPGLLSSAQIARLAELLEPALQTELAHLLRQAPRASSVFSSLGEAPVTALGSRGFAGGVPAIGQLARSIAASVASSVVGASIGNIGVNEGAKQ